MPLSKSDRNFVEWLKETLIPDLVESGYGATAEDFERCIQIIEDLARDCPKPSRSKRK